ncbi:MAG TPA: YggT family protein [Aeromicrobium sp.]|jgi:YggT family protein|nr:YggT family protein [Aeromicrobium sp.]HKY57688.1 YggT family protein [Aeromicrobium sp.]
MAVVGEILLFITWVAVLVLLARFIIDWVQVLARSWRPTGFVAVLCEAIFTITDPPLRAIRGVIPPIRMGGAMLDLSPMVLLIGIYIVQILVRATML